MHTPGSFESENMDSFTLIRQGVLFLHVMAFAIALSAVLREDLALLRARRVDALRLAETARILTSALAVLWLSGLALVAFDTGLNVRALMGNAKLAAKLLVVTALTANGLALHALVFPMLRRAQPQEPARQPPRRVRAGGLAPLWHDDVRAPIGNGNGRDGLSMAVVLGAISTASWLYASFVGVSRHVSPVMSFADFMALYGALLAGAITIALVFVRPRLARLLGGGALGAEARLRNPVAAAWTIERPRGAWL